MGLARRGGLCFTALIARNRRRQRFALLIGERVLGAKSFDRLRVGSRVGSTVDRREYQAVAVVVENRQRERKVSAHLLKRVVSDDAELLQGIPVRVALLLQDLKQLIDALVGCLQSAQRPPNGREDVTVLAIVSAHERIFAAQFRNRRASNSPSKKAIKATPARIITARVNWSFVKSGTVRHFTLQMMKPEDVRSLLDDVSAGKTSPDKAVDALRQLPVEDLGFAKLDVHRELRQGMPEAVFGEGKTPEQTVAISRRLLETTDGPVIITRANKSTTELVAREWPDAVVHERSGLVVLRPSTESIPGMALVACAGTSDLPVAEEAAFTLQALGVTVSGLNDVGVAGLHRVLSSQAELHSADVVIVVAGMEGALASLVGGITAAPVVAVPTSVGYGASFDGLAALLAMLNSCAAGITVTNIDNGFGAAMSAFRVLRKQAGLP
jgi:NCAIR mutase (PurE)-related protein